MARNALPNFERRTIEAAVRFANMRAVNSEEQVLRCFKAAIDEGSRRLSPRPHFSTELPPAQKCHATLRGWLQLIASSEGGKQQVSEQVNEVLEDVSAAVVARLDPRRRLSIRFVADTVEAVCAVAMALILDEQRGLARRLAVCGHCGKFNLDLRSEGGRPRKFCSDEHKRLFDAKDSANRQARFRERHRQRRRKP